MTRFAAAPAPPAAPPPAGEIPGLPQDVEPGTKLIPQEGVTAAQDILGGILWVVLFVLMAVALSSLGFAAVAKATGRPQLAERGVIVFAACLALAVLAGIAIPLVNNAYKLT